MDVPVECLKIGGVNCMTEFPMNKVVICILALTALTACGIKPSNVKPPEGATTVYPRVYPNPEHDGDVGPNTPPSQPADLTEESEAYTKE